MTKKTKTEWALFIAAGLVSSPIWITLLVMGGVLFVLFLPVMAFDYFERELDNWQ